MKKKIIIVSASIFGILFSVPPTSAGLGMPTLLLSSNVAIARPLIVPKPITLPVPPSIPTTICPVPPIAKPAVSQIKWNPDKGGTPCAPRIHHNTRKAGKQEAQRDSRRGGGGGPDGKNGKVERHSGKHGDHYHGVDKKGDTLPRHHYIPKTVTVSKGDTLSKIADTYGLDYRKIARINGISDPNKIRIGQVIKLV